MDLLRERNTVNVSLGVFAQMCVAPLRSVATLEWTLVVDLPRLTTPTTKAAEPPAQGGTKILGTLVEHCVVTNWERKDFCTPMSCCHAAGTCSKGF